MLLSLVGTFLPHIKGELWWLNRYNYKYDETNICNYYSNTFNGETMGRINDISHCSINNRGVWVVSENKFPGIWISEDDLKSWMVFPKIRTLFS